MASEAGKSSSLADVRAFTKSGGNTVGAVKDREYKQKEETQPSYEEQLAAANESNTPNAAKYMLATNLARQELANQEGVTDKQFRELIDSKFDKMNPTVSGSEMRGEDGFSNVMRTLSEGWDDLLRNGGTAIDDTFDGALGAVGGLLGNEDMFSTIQNAFDGQDIGQGLDLASDIALAAIPGAGIPLSLAKAGIQQYGNFRDALRGVDGITGEKLTDEQNLGRGGEAILSTLMSAVPGAGKATQLARSMQKSKNVAEALPDLIKSADVAEQKLASGIGDNLPDAKMAELKQEADLARGVADAAKERANSRIPSPAQVSQDAKDYTISRLMEKNGGKMPETPKTIKEAKEEGGYKGAAKALAKKAAALPLGTVGGKEGLKNLGRGAASFAGAAANSSLADMGTYGSNSNLFSGFQHMSPGSMGLATLMYAPGSGMVSRKFLPGLKGYNQKLVPSNTGIASLRVANAGDFTDTSNQNDAGINYLDSDMYNILKRNE